MDSQAWWYTPVIPALGRLRQEDHDFEASLGYRRTRCLKKTKMRVNGDLSTLHTKGGIF
jgi:hypothetical protein